MQEDGKDIARLDEQDADLLNKKGWFLVTYFQSKQGGQGSTAYNNAMEKALTLKRDVGLRSYVKDDYTYWEVWEHY